MTTSGFALEVEHGPKRIADADLVTVPAWPQLEEHPPEPLTEALQEAVARGARVLSVCTGAFLLASAGLLDGRRAATHWQFTDRLARRHPRIRVDRDVLYVEDGPVLSSAGAAAGIDACLHLVRSEHGAATANALARRMVVPAHRSGGQAQFVEMPVTRTEYGLTGLVEWMQEHLNEALTVEALAVRASMSPRTFARRFKAATGTTPHRWLLDQRLQLAEELLESTSLPVDAVAARSGFGSGDTLRHHFAARRRTGPAAHRRTFRAESVTASGASPRLHGGKDRRMEIWINPACSKCSSALSLLDGEGVEYTIRRYLEEPPTADELEDVLRRLSLEPWDITRTGEKAAAELGVDSWPREQEHRARWLEALAAHPALIQRPIITADDGTAVVGRTPEAVKSAIR
jgi:arsenate reductase (glutaredoxin)